MITRLLLLPAAAWLVLLLVGAGIPKGAVFAQEAPGVWRTADGPTAFITHLAVDPNEPDFVFIIVAHGTTRYPDRTQGAEGYLRMAWAPYISGDGGETWQAASNDLAYTEPTTAVILPGPLGSTIWVGTAGHGLWRSDNRGRTWRPVLVRGLNGQRVVALTRDARNRLHLATLDNTRYPDSHLYTSTDGGYNWEHRLLQPFTNRPETYVTDLIADPFEADRLYAVTFGGLLYTTNAGFSWQTAVLPWPEGITPGGETVLVADPTQRGRLYLVGVGAAVDGTTVPGVYRSLNGGVSWERLPATFRSTYPLPPGQSPRPYRLRLDPLSRFRLLLATHSGLWVSADAGLTWTTAGSALEGVAVTDVFMHPHQRGRWLTAGAGGIWQTMNAGSRWQALGRGLPPASSLHSLVSLPDGTLLALNGGANPIPAAVQPLWRSSDGGRTWMPAMAGLAGRHLSRLLVHPWTGHVYGLTTTGLVRSSNGGRSWTFVPTPVAGTHLAFGRVPGWLLLGSNGGLWRSTDEGQTWEAVRPEPVLALAGDLRGRFYLIPATGAGQEGRRLWQSADGGLTWNPVAPVPEGDIAGFIAHPTQADSLLLWRRWGGLLLSTDGGRTWQRRDNGIPAGTQWQGPQPLTPVGPQLLTLFIHPRRPQEWWVGRDGGGVFTSTDEGRTWRDATGDLGDTLIYSFAPVGAELVAGSSNGGLLRLTTTPGPQMPPPEVDARIEILWPHDFAPVTTAARGNLGIRLYAGRSQEVPPCAWMPSVEVWMAQDAQPLRRLGVATQRTVEGHPFPFWELNDVDLTWAQDPTHKLIFMVRVVPELAESRSTVWIHAADARTYLPNPPEPIGLTATPPAAIDAVLRVAWPHDEQNHAVPVEQANLLNLSAVLFAQGTQLALAPEHSPERVWLVAALDNSVGRRLMVGEPRTVAGSGFVYTTYEFNNVDVSLARDPNHHWSFWLEVPGRQASSNVWVHGSDGRTHAPELLEPIAACRP
jgi:photosystem II stability/assembly factor-like uncharacterized protein